MVFHAIFDINFVFLIPMNRRYLLATEWVFDINVNSKQTLSFATMFTEVSSAHRMRNVKICFYRKRKWEAVDGAFVWVQSAVFAHKRNAKW